MLNRCSGISNKSAWTGETARAGVRVEVAAEGEPVGTVGQL